MRLLPSLLVIALLSACAATPPSEFYILNSLGWQMLLIL